MPSARHLADKRRSAGPDFAVRKKNHTVMAPKTKTPDRLTVEERRELPASAFGIPETREFPLVDAAHSGRRKPISVMHPTTGKPPWRAAFSPAPAKWASTSAAV